MCETIFVYLHSAIYLYKQYIHMKYSHLLSRYILWATLLLLGTGRAAAQSWNLVNNDTLVIDACQTSTGTIYDDGGPDGNYSNYFNGWVVITTQPGVSISLGGSYVTESCCDYLDVWDGDADGTLLINHAGGTGTLAPVSATSGRMTIYFHTDVSVVYGGFELTYAIAGGGQIAGLTATAVSENGATLQWSTTEPGPFHVLVDGTEVGTTAATEYTLTGLGAARRYRATIYPDSFAGDFCHYYSTSFRTACGLSVMPLEEDFNDLTAEAMPPCWTRSTNFDDAETQPRLIDAGSGNLVLMVSCGNSNTGGHYGLVAGPVTVDAEEQWLVDFDYRASHNGTVVVIGTCDSTSPEHQYYGFTPLDTLTITNNTQWTHYHKALTPPAGACRLAFRMVQQQQNGVGRMAYLDNIAVEDCGIDRMWLNHVDSTSVVMHWLAVGTPTMSIGIRPEGALADDTVIVGTGSPQLIEGLLPDQSYTLTLYPMCYGRDHLPASATVHTLPSVGLRSTLCENPADYVNYSYVLRADWTVGGGNHYIGSNYIQMYQETYLATPPIDALGGKEVSVSYRSNTTTNSNSYSIILGTMAYADDPSTFNPIDTIHNFSSRWQTLALHIPDNRTDRYVAILNQTPYYLYIQGVGVDDCVARSARITEVHHDNVTLAWDDTMGPTDTMLVGYSYNNTTFQYDTLVGVTEHTVRGLAADSDISFRIRRTCGETCELLDLTTHTPREPQPLCENFDGSYAALFPLGSTPRNPYRWFKPNTNYIDTTQRYHHSGSRSIRINNYGSYKLTLPYIDSIAGNVVTFWARSIIPTSEVRVSSSHMTYFDQSYSNEWIHNAVDTIAMIGDGMWHHYGVTLPDTLTGRVSLSYHQPNGGSAELWLDDLQAGVCGYGDFTFANLSSHSVDVVWESLGASAARIRLVGGSDVIDTVAVPDTVHFTGLDSMTVYRCYVAPIRGTDTLCLSYAGQFSTTKYPVMYIDGIPMCNTFDEDTLPRGWAFSDSTAVTMTGSTMRIAPGQTEDTLWLPSIRSSALYIAARGLSGSDTLFVDGDTTVLDTVWRHFCYEPDPTPGHHVELRIRTGSASGGSELDHVGFSNCPILDFTPDGNRIHCHVRHNLTPELLLTLTDDEGTDRNYYINTANYTIEGLPAATHFTVRWRCLYMSDGCMPTLEVQTGPVALPYCVDFNNNNTSLPDGWKVVGQTGDAAEGYSINYYRFYSSYTYSYYPEYHVNNHWTYILLPEAEESDNLTVTISGINSIPQQMEIGVLPTPADTSTFITASSFGYNDAAPWVADLSQLPHGRVAIRIRQGNFYIQRIQLFDAPRISQTHLYRYDTLTFTSSDSGTYGLQYLFTANGSGDFSSTPSLTMVDTSVFAFPVVSNSRYMGYRQTNADGETDCFSSPTYYPVHKPKSAPYCEDFQSSNYYMHYFQVYKNSCSGWQYSIAYNNETHTYDRYLEWNSNGNWTMTFPYMLVDSAGMLSASFNYRYTNTTGFPTNNLLVAGVLTDALDSNTFEPLDTVAMITDGQWHTAKVSYHSYHGKGRWIGLREAYSGIYHTVQLDDIHIEACQGANFATATLERYNVVRLENSVDETFFVEYGPSGFVRGNGTLQAVDTTPYRLTLTPETEYDFFFYCDSVGAPCAKAQQVTTLAPPLTVPLCIDFDTNTANLKPRYWNSVAGSSAVSDSVSRSGDNSLMVAGTIATPDIDVDSLQEISIGLWVMTTEAGTRLMVGTVSDPTDAISFHNLKTIVPEQTGVWEHHFVSFANTPSNAHFIALRNSSGDNRTLFVDDLHLTYCAAFDMRVKHMDNNSIALAWNQVGTPAVSFTVNDNGASATYTPTADSIILPITPLHSYTIAMHSECPSGLPCNVDYNDTLHIVAPVEGVGCVNPTDLQSPQAVFYSGSYLNPYSAAGAIDCGSRSPDSRHTVCYDTTERDPRTGGLLRTIPEGYTSSVRLGNWSTNYTSPEAEGVLYSLFIDTMSFNLLMMRYAAVLQDPMHDASDQPRFRLELLDSAYNLIDPVCAAADFIANRNLGWNEAADNVLWKDWTPVGIDVSAYAGQQVYVRLTTYDCNEGSHYGYAYFTLECMRKSIDAETCGIVDSNRFTAPAGFNYRWYTATSPTTISTERSLVVPTADMATYFCDLTFVGNASCNFTLSAFGGPRLPLARVDTTVSITDCHFDVQFTNRSTVSPDGITPAPTNEQVETAFWDFGNGETSNSYHGHTVYDTIGIYTVTLIIGISGGACTDTLVWPMRVEPPTYPYITGPDRLCFGDTDTLRLYGGIPYGDSLWADGGDHWYLPLSTSNYNLGTNTYSLLTTDPYGCHPPASHTLTVNPVHHTTDSVRICNPLLPYSYRDTLFLAGTTVGDFYFHHTTTEGCDSNFHLWLSVNDTSAGTYRDTLQASICDNQSFLFYGSGFTDAGIHNQVHVDATGACDSIHTLVLDVRPTSAVDTLVGACDSFTWHGVTYNTDTVQPHLDLNSHNCDSVTTLHLTVHYTSDTAIAHTVVENSLPYLWNGISFTTDTAGCLITLPNAQGCDSLITFQLTVYRNHDTTLYRSLCEGEFPVVWNGVTFSLAEADPTTHTITHQTTLHTWQNADSSLTMHLQVLYNTTSVIHDTLLQNALATYAAPFGMPVSYLPQDSDPARVLLADTTLVGTNAAGCDSTVSYTLHVYRNYQSVDSVFICASRLPYLWQGVTFHGDSTATVVLPTVHGADSLATRVVTVYPVYDVTDTLVICPYRPYLYEDVDFGGPGTYDVPHTTVDGCDSMVHVTLMPRDTAFRLTPEARLADDPWAPHDTVLLGCIPSLLELRDTSASLSRTWAFFSDDTLTSTDTLFSIRMDTTGIFGFQLIALSPEGCYDTVHNDSLLWVFPNPQAAFTYYPEPIPAHQPETQFTNASLPDSCTYLWLIPRDPEASYTDSLREASPAYQWEDGSPQGEYPVALVAYLLHHGPDSLTVTCTDTLQVPVVIVNTYLQFPNLVSPNGDGVDDIWMVGNLLEMGQYTMNELWIYDRTGMLVYHVRNIATESQFWDPNATRSPDGTYYYRFSARTYNGLVKRNGVIEVVR